MMTKERIDAISEFLAKDLEGTKKLLDAEPDVAAAKMTAEGFAVTADELVEYGEEIKRLSAQSEGELAEGDLENVAGGIATATLIIIGLVAGYAMAKGKW